MSAPDAALELYNVASRIVDVILESRVGAEDAPSGRDTPGSATLMNINVPAVKEVRPEIREWLAGGFSSPLSIVISVHDLAANANTMLEVWQLAVWQSSGGPQLRAGPRLARQVAAIARLLPAIELRSVTADAGQVHFSVSRGPPPADAGFDYPGACDELALSGVRVAGAEVVVSVRYRNSRLEVSPAGMDPVILNSHHFSVLEPVHESGVETPSRAPRDTTSTTRDDATSDGRWRAAMRTNDGLRPPPRARDHSAAASRPPRGTPPTHPRTLSSGSLPGPHRGHRRQPSIGSEASTPPHSPPFVGRQGGGGGSEEPGDGSRGVLVQRRPITSHNPPAPSSGLRSVMEGRAVLTRPDGVPLMLRPRTSLAGPAPPTSPALDLVAVSPGHGGSPLELTACPGFLGPSSTPSTVLEPLDQAAHRPAAQHHPSTTSASLPASALLPAGFGRGAPSGHTTAQAATATAAAAAACGIAESGGGGVSGRGRTRANADGAAEASPSAEEAAAEAAAAAAAEMQQATPAGWAGVAGRGERARRATLAFGTAPVPRTDGLGLGVSSGQDVVGAGRRPPRGARARRMSVQPTGPAGAVAVAGGAGAAGAGAEARRGVLLWRPTAAVADADAEFARKGRAREDGAATGALLAGRGRGGGAGAEAEAAEAAATGSVAVSAVAGAGCSHTGAWGDGVTAVGGDSSSEDDTEGLPFTMESSKTGRARTEAVMLRLKNAQQQAAEPGAPMYLRTFAASPAQLSGGVLRAQLRVLQRYAAEQNG